MQSQTRKRGNISSVDNCNSYSSAVVIASNIDLLSQILIILPSKSLLIFKSVSKHWYSLVSEPHFCRRHFLQNPRFSVLGLYWSPCWNQTAYDYINIDRHGYRYASFQTIKFDKNNVQIVQSCHGLFLCRYDCSKSIYYIYNPFTRQYRVLPKSLLRKEGFTCNGNVSLVYDPRQSLYYKVLCVWNNWDVDTNYSKTKIEIYSSETKSWKLCGYGDEYILPQLIGPWPGVFWNGMLNWVSPNQSLMYYDIDREVIRVVSGPHQDNPSHYGDHAINSFGEYAGHLFCIEVSDKICARFNVYEMDRNYTAWNVKYRVDLEGLRVFHPRLSFLRGYNLVSFDEEEKDSPELVLLIHDSEVVISYDLRSMSSEKLCNVASQGYAVEGRPFQECFSVGFYKYIDSLACV